jgi:WD40 repeat protein
LTVFCFTVYDQFIFVYKNIKNSFFLYFSGVGLGNFMYLPKRRRMVLFRYRAVLPIVLLFPFSYAPLSAYCLPQAVQRFVPSITPSTALTGFTDPAGATYSWDGRFLSFTQNNAHLLTYTVGQDGALTLLTTYPTPAVDAPYSAAYNPAAPVLQEAGFASTAPLSLFSYDQQTGLLIFPALETRSAGGDNTIESRFSPFGSYVASANVNTLTGTNSSSITLLQISSTGIKNSFLLNTYHNFNATTANQLSFSSDERFLAAANYDNASANGSISLYAITCLQQPLTYLQQVSIPNSNGITSVAYSPRGDLLAAANNGSSLYIFSVDQATGMLTLLTTQTTGLTVGLQSLAFSPDGNFLLAASSNSSAVAVFARASDNTFSKNSDTLACTGNPTQLLFSPLLTNGTAFFAALSKTGGSITTYTFALAQPFGKLAQTLRNKYLYKQ